MSKTLPFVLLGVLMLLGIIGLIGYAAFVNYQYEAKIGSYFDNARDSITPEAILVQLEAGKQAMVDEKLTEDLYGAWIFKKPDNSMKFQYQHLEGIIERAKAVEEWKTATYSGNATTTENFGDVYNEKMDNLRMYIHGEEERSDWIAKDAWMLKNHFFVEVWSFWIGVLLSVLCVLFFSIAITEEYY
jgi:hypothetical protein